MKNQKHIPLEKLSKQKKREFYAEKRGSWNGVNPISRVVPSGKLYDRRKEKGRQIADLGE